jgi:hypothetical protein
LEIERSFSLSDLRFSISETQKPWSSFLYIQDRVSSYFQDRNEKIYFPTIDRAPVKTSGETLNILLFGNVFIQLLQSVHLFPERFKVWVLCRKYVPFLTSVFGLSEDQVGVIPRRIFIDSAPHAPREIDSFVFAGRAHNRTKRVQLAIKLVEHCRRISGRDFKFHVSHAGPGVPPRDGLYQANVRGPTWLEHSFGFGSDWASKFPRSVFLSLSHHEFEDMGVAPCEALSRGLPCVLSDWGGYSDFVSESVLKLPTISSWSATDEDMYGRIHAPKVLGFIGGNRLQPRLDPANGMARDGNSEPKVSYLQPLVARLRSPSYVYKPKLLKKVQILPPEYSLMNGFLVGDRKWSHEVT